MDPQMDYTAMTLRRLRANHPGLFYPQTWFEDEPFMDTPIPPVVVYPTTEIVFQSRLEPDAASLPLAVVVAVLYCVDPTHPLWSKYIWCADCDRDGQLVYVGDNGHGLEIHRHLRLTDRWGVITWT